MNWLHSVLTYQTLYYNQTLDHVANYHPSNPRWSHRYLLNDSFWGKGVEAGPLSEFCKGPILFYTGNEGPITAFWDGNGFIMELTQKWGGLMIMPEERYYGESIPSGSYEYLSTQQVLEDYVEILQFIKGEYDATSCPVVSFGGSYGGTLTTFLRAAYPSAVIGALASSAPIGYYDKENWASHDVDEFTFSEIIAHQYDQADPQCLSKIWDATDAINAANTEILVSAFNVCDASGLGPAKPDLFLYGLEGLCQQNYPYRIGDMPAWPVSKACDMLLSAEDGALIDAAAAVTGMALGYDVTAGSCFQTLVEGPGGVPGDGPGQDSWGYQSCTETVHEFSSRGKDGGGIRKYAFDMQTSANAVCKESFPTQEVAPNPTALTARYGGYMLGDGDTDLTNVIWSTGSLDPWGGGCFHSEHAPADAAERGLYYFTIPLGAHHFDLRGRHEDDPRCVVEVRAQEEKIIRGWIDEFIEDTML